MSNGDAKQRRMSNDAKQRQVDESSEAARTDEQGRGRCKSIQRERIIERRLLLRERTNERLQRESIATDTVRDTLVRLVTTRGRLIAGPAEAPLIHNHR